LLSIVFIFIVTAGHAQTYYPFPKQGARWSEGGNFCEDAQPCATGWCHGNGWLYCEANDTIIKGNVYSLIGFNLTLWTTSYNCDFYDEGNISYSIPGFIFGAVREDSTRKVWFRRIADLIDQPLCLSPNQFPLDSDILLYDFGVQLNDTLKWKF